MCTLKLPFALGWGWTRWRAHLSTSDTVDRPRNSLPGYLDFGLLSLACFNIIYYTLLTCECHNAHTIKGSTSNIEYKLQLCWNRSEKTMERQVKAKSFVTSQRSFWKLQSQLPAIEIQIEIQIHCVETEAGVETETEIKIDIRARKLSTRKFLWHSICNGNESQSEYMRSAMKWRTNRKSSKEERKVTSAMAEVIP